MQSLLRPEWSRKMRFFSFLSMFLLVYVHAYDLNDRYLQPFSFLQEKMTFTTFFEYLTANGLFRFRIPMLFAISGYLLAHSDSKGYGRMLLKRVRTLALPFFLWTSIGGLIALGLYQWSFTHASVLNIHMQPTEKNWDAFGPREWLAVITDTNVSYQLWFLRSLFVLNLAYPALRFLVLRYPKTLFVTATVLWMLTPWSPLFLLPPSWMGSWMKYVENGEGLLPFCLGIWLCKRGKNLSQPPRWFSMRVFVPLFLLLAACRTVMAYYGNPLNPLPVGIPMWFLYKVMVAVGLLVAWFGADRVADWCISRRWFRALSDQTFMIYALHVPLVTFLIDPVHGLLQPFRYYRLTTYLLLPLVIIAAAVLIGMLLKTLAPPLFGLLTGDRGLKPLKVAGHEPAVGKVTAVVPEPLPSTN